MCFFLYLLINAHRFNSPLLHFFFTHTHKHDKAETLSLQICVCVFASPQLVTSGPSSPDRLCTGMSTASDILPWLATGEFSSFPSLTLVAMLEDTSAECENCNTNTERLKYSHANTRLFTMHYSLAHFSLSLISSCSVL